MWLCVSDNASFSEMSLKYRKRFQIVSVEQDRLYLTGDRMALNLVYATNKIEICMSRGIVSSKIDKYLEFPLNVPYRNV